MNRKQRKTLEAVFAKPTTKALEWSALESLLIAVGCRPIEGSGSRIKFVYEQQIVAFHRPHPAKDAKAYQVEQARTFLECIGVKP